MNKFIGIGNLTADPELRFTPGTGTAVTRLKLAISRNFKNKDGKYDSDFISCIAFGKTAETIANHFAKGNKIAVTGRIQTGSYDNKDGQKVYTTDVIIEEFEFVEKKKKTEKGSSDDDGFYPVDDSDNDIPF